MNANTIKKLAIILLYLILYIRTQERVQDKRTQLISKNSVPTVRNNFTLIDNPIENNINITVKKIWFNTISFKGKNMDIESSKDVYGLDQLISTQRVFHHQENKVLCSKIDKSVLELNAKFSGNCVLPILTVRSMNFPDISDHIDEIHVKTDQVGVAFLNEMEIKDEITFEYEDLVNGQYAVNDQKINIHDFVSKNQYFCALCLSYQPNVPKNFGFTILPVKNGVTENNKIFIPKLTDTNGYFFTEENYIINNLSTLVIDIENYDNTIDLEVTSLKDQNLKLTLINVENQKILGKTEFKSQLTDKFVDIKDKSFILEIYNPNPVENGELTL